MATEVLPSDVVTFGSGKLVTPCARMQRENANALAPGPPCALAAAPDNEADDGEVPPQPAAITAMTAPVRRAVRARADGREKMDGIGVIAGVL
ncbi:MAG TPA: hypothetical protein VMF14_19870 [Solirubrobacteraceae bacterium]|nr:hypothetical protein [Solirubrobacteraceae bacterium]